MSVLVQLTGAGVALSGEAPPRPAPIPVQPPNAGKGDVRKGVVPVIAWPPEPGFAAWESGAFVSLAQHLDAPQAGAGLLLQTKDDPLALSGRTQGLALIAVEFARLSDGRGYSCGVLLRSRVGWTGPLRALGAITVDQLQALARCGYDEFLLRADQDPALAERALSTFTVAYQASVAGLTRAVRP